MPSNAHWSSYRPRMIDITYKCRCMSAEATFQVRNRVEGEDIATWMYDVQRKMGEDHTKRSPLCLATKVEYAKIPAPENAPFIGGQPKLNS
jgi:hypothetical protein